MKARPSWLLGLAGVGLVASQWRDIRRFIAIRRISTGSGHPELVPAAGRARYPRPDQVAGPDTPVQLRSAERGDGAES
jgi:hypothetical protein